MDPLSITTSVITFTQLVIKGLQTVRSIQNAPTEIGDLLERVWELEVVVEGI
jgi:hypothetical protein